MRKQMIFVLIFLLSFLAIGSLISSVVYATPEGAEGPQPGDPTPGTPFTPTNGTRFVVQAGNAYRIHTNAGYRIELSVNQGLGFNITEYANSPHSMGQNQYRIRTQTMAIEMNVSAQVQANLSYVFDNQVRNQLGVKKMERLQFMFYNESEGSWQAPRYQWLEGDTLYCNTTHFSLWTITEEEASTSTDSTPGFEIVSLGLVLTLAPLVALKSRKNK